MFLERENPCPISLGAGLGFLQFRKALSSIFEFGRLRGRIFPHLFELGLEFPLGVLVQMFPNLSLGLRIGWFFAQTDGKWGFLEGKVIPKYFLDRNHLLPRSLFRFRDHFDPSLTPGHPHVATRSTLPLNMRVGYVLRHELGLHIYEVPSRPTKILTQPFRWSSLWEEKNTFLKIQSKTGRRT